MLRSSRPPSRPALRRQVCTGLNASIQSLRRASNSNRPLPLETSSREDSGLNESATKVAILGGGITGLAAALWLKRPLNDKVQITIFESSNRLGGWLQSTKHTVNGETVIFEHGPRSLRPILSLAGVTTDYTVRLLFSIA
jgi:NAD(P)-binding Rossmann-like domain